MACRVDIRDLRVCRGDFVLQDVSLSVEPREIFAILGQTGSGKTVLLESLAGAFPFESGTIFLNGLDATLLPVQERHMGIVYQDYALFPHMTVLENVMYGLRRHGLSKADAAEKAHEMLELFGISSIESRYPGVISGGEAQRTALARAMALRPQLLLLDEPFAALDPTTKACFYETVRNVHERFDCTILFVTHDFHEAQTLADRIGIVLDGRLRAVVESKYLFEQSFDEDVRLFLGI